MDQPFELGNINHPVAIYVVHSEGPSDFLLGSAAGRDVQSQHELPKVNSSASIRVKSSKDVLGKLFRVSSGKYLAVDLHQMFLAQLAVGAVL